MNLWTHPSNYSGATWEGWFVFLSRNRDSDCLTRSNFEQGLEAVRAVASPDPVPGDEDDSATVLVVRENHWAVGWVEWIAIHQSDLEAVKEAERLEERLENYPVLNDEHFSSLEAEEANQIWRDCYSVKERVDYVRRYRSQFEFSDFADMLGCIRGHYFSGYASELFS